MRTASALAHPNIAFIKYWGDLDPGLRIALNSSLSMNLDGLHTRTQVRFDESLSGDVLILDGQPVTGPALDRVTRFLDHVRSLAGVRFPAEVTSANNFPTGAGIASSASAFAALSLAAASALGLSLTEIDLSRLARLGSGSACRSVPGGFVEWQAGSDHASSYAYSIASPSHWDLVDCIAIVDDVHKPTGSSEGHTLSGTSPLQAARVADTPRRLELCRRAVLERDFDLLASIVEVDCNMMHAVMLTSSPPLVYWQPATLEIIQSVQAWRGQGVSVCYTIDAGPNVHVITLSSEATRIHERLRSIPSIANVLLASPGGPARLTDPFTGTG
ncbi:MAG: diphosphomevalonate decarboxylase [Chloroflexota bacterium]|nr:MAG: diphosphomevalonate decarboxylase [Chloroflexota bacterium]